MRDPNDPFHTTRMCDLPWPEDARFRSNTTRHNGEELLIGSAEVRVFGEKGAIYAASTLIYHYVADNHYKPPHEFVCALLVGPRPPSEAYRALLKRELGLKSWR